MHCNVVGIIAFGIRLSAVYISIQCQNRSLASPEKSETKKLDNEMGPTSYGPPEANKVKINKHLAVPGLCLRMRIIQPMSFL